MAEFVNRESVEDVVSQAKQGTFAKFVKDTELERAVALATEKAKMKVIWEWGEKTGVRCMTA